MEFSLFIPLMVAAIQSSGQVLSAFVAKAKETAKNFVFDKEFFEDTVVESSEQLANLINIVSLDLKQEIREQSILDVIQDLQAHIASIGELLSLAKTNEITPLIAEQLIRNGLVPLKTSLKKAEIRLGHYHRDDMQLFCHVVGTNTLIAGYAYLGQTVPTLQKDLELSIYVFQKRLLDSIAKSNHEIPWNRVPHLLTTNGITELVTLYNSTSQDMKKIPPEERLSVTPKDDEEGKEISPPEKKRKVKEMNLQGTTGTARILHGLLTFNLSCSECGYKGVHHADKICPNCQRKFV